MKIMLTLSLLLLLTLNTSWLFGQDAPLHPTKTQTAVYFDISPPLCEMQLILPVKKEADENEVPNKIGKKEYFNLKYSPFNLPEDPVWQKQDGTYLPVTTAPIQNFDGITNISGYYPPDTQGDISTDKYVQVVNVNFAVYSKTGTLLFGPAALSTIWAGIPAPWNGTNSGDPVVLYDQAANRWLITQFSLPAGSTTQYAELVAVSQTSDPTGAWYRYVFQYGSNMPDYPKFGVWPDGYYMSVNQFAGGASWAGVGASAFERTKMIAGDPSAQMIYFDLGASGDPEGMLPSDWDGVTPPISGEPDYFTYFNDWTSLTDRYLKTWAFHADWITPANSTFAEVSSLVTASFDADLCTGTRERCIPQPGTAIKLEALSDRLMYRLQYRNFGTYRTMVTNHTVDVDATGHAGIRWYELRNTGAGWGIYQQGTFSPDAAHRWVGSIAMNSVGDIALGYSVSDATAIYPSIRYTGRKPGDPLGVMTVAEQTLIAGTGSQTGSAARWGDYSMMSVDPSDDVTFWYTTEYVQATGSATWKTRIASFVISNAPSAFSLPAYAITTTAATLSGSVNPHGLATNYHFEYGSTLPYTNSTPAIYAGSGSTPISVSAGITGLIAGTTYSFRLVAVNSDGTSTGTDLTFIPGAAILTTTTPSSITGNSANSGGNITYDGGVSVTARGVCWGSSLNPTISGNHTSNGSGTGVFTSAITGLAASSLYHVRAYATNGAGTFYGDDISFSTACGVFGLPFYEGFTTTSIPACWTQTDHQGNGQIWQFGTITGYSINPALTGNYAYLNSDGYGSGNSQNADLVSPLLDLSAYASVDLSFRYYFRSYTLSSGTLSFSIDNGANWAVIQNFTAGSANPATFSQAIPGVAGQPLVKFKWNYTGTYGYYWAIDDVVISGLPVNRQLSNITISSGTASCYNAAQTITVAGSGTTFTVQSGGSATLIAGLKIDILPGAFVQSGGYFHGYIAPAGPFCINPSYIPENTAGTIIEHSPEQSPALISDLFKVYPNPTSGKFTVEINRGAESNEKVEILVYSVMGSLVMKEELTRVLTSEFTLTGKPDGIYFIKVVSGSNTGITKIIKH